MSALGTPVCAFDDLAPGDTRTVHVSGDTDATDCGELVNVATVSASNEADDDASGVDVLFAKLRESQGDDEADDVISIVRSALG